jgi:hypothetical protein
MCQAISEHRSSDQLQLLVSEEFEKDWHEEQYIQATAERKIYEGLSCTGSVEAEEIAVEAEARRDDESVGSTRMYTV